MDKKSGRAMVSDLGYRKMVQPALILLWMYILAGDLLGGDFAVRSETVQTPMFKSSDVGLIEVFCDADDRMFLRVTVKENTRDGRHFVYYADGRWVPVKEYGGLWNTFSKNGYLHLACEKGDDILIYRAHKEIELVSTISTAGALHFVPWALKTVTAVPEQDNSYCIVAARSVFPTNPVEFLFDFTSGGHGIYYVKPVLVEVADGKPGKPRKLDYGGKRNETYYIKQVVCDGDFAHFLGFRQQEKRAWGPEDTEPTPVILHHAAYDLKKKKVTQTNAIYTETPSTVIETQTAVRYSYGDVSIHSQAGSVFVAFVWQMVRTNRTYTDDENFVRTRKSEILYWDNSGGKSAKAEKVADGFSPIVKADSLGNAHLLYVNGSANLMHKVKWNGAWEKEEVLVERVDMRPWDNNMGAVFDKNGNLHVVYPLEGNLVHAILKLN